MTIAHDIDVLDSEERSSRSGPIGWFFGVVADRRTWGAIFYMLLALPLGIGYFTFVVTAGTLSLTSLILIVGLVLVPLFFAMVRVLSLVEGYIVGALLGASIPHVEESEDGDSVDTLDIVEMSEEGMDDVRSGNRLWGAIKRMLIDVRSYTSMIYMALMLPLGISYFTVVITGFVTSIALFFSPIAHLVGDEVIVMDVSASDPAFLVNMAEFANSPLGAVAACLIGFFGFFLMMHLVRGVGWVHARLAEVMLVKRK